MANEEDDSPATEKKGPKLEVRDLKPEKEVKGGARNGRHGKERLPAKTGEMDFMNWE